MKNITPQLLAHYRSGSTTLARLLQIERTDERQFFFTSHDEPITFLGHRYEPSSVFDSSTVKSRSDMSVDNMSATGILDSEGITAQDMEAGLWDGADFRIVEVNYRDLTMGANVLRVGRFGEVQRTDSGYSVELRGLTHYLQTRIGRIITSACDAELGDNRCKVDLEALRVENEVAAPLSQREFVTYTLPGTFSIDQYFQFGELQFTSGANAGLRMEIKSQVQNVVMLQLSMPYPIQVGDTFTIVPGCNKIHAVENGQVTGDCFNKFDNVINFRAFDAVPGQDKVLRVGGQ